MKIIIWVSIFLFLFGLVFFVSPILFPEWLLLENWQTKLTISILAGALSTLIIKILELLLTKLLKLDNISKMIDYYLGDKYHNIEDRVLEFTKTQIKNEIKSGKYIPSVFIETVEIKEKLRYFSDPYLFIEKIQE